MPKTVKIHSSVSGTGPDVVLIHGLFGMGSNLGALSRDLMHRYRVHSVDLPNHGRSGSMGAADIPKMALALLAWMDQQELKSASVLGHSLGGKVAMELALRNAQRVDALVVADIAPVAYEVGHRREFAALAAVEQARCQSRSEAANIMSQHLEEDMVVQFLLKNLTRNSEGVYEWLFDLAELVASYAAIRAAISPGANYPGPVLFLKGGESSYIQEHHRELIVSLFPSVSLKIMPGCGHWLHAQEPRLFNSLVGRFLDRQQTAL